MTTTPDYAGLIRDAEEAQDWMRVPDWAEKFSLVDMATWINNRPTRLLPRLCAAIRTLLERYEALERERDEARRQSDRFCDKYLAALSRAEAAEAERDRLTERVAELEKVREVAVDALKWLSNAARYDKTVTIYAVAAMSQINGYSGGSV